MLMPNFHNKIIKKKQNNANIAVNMLIIISFKYITYDGVDNTRIFYKVAF